MPLLHVDQGHAKLNEIAKQYEGLRLSDANEAETRKKVIDHILEDVLGWLEDDISYEERCSEDGSTTFADYIVRTATTQIVVEAKRAGAAFRLPPRLNSGKLGGVLGEGEIGEAIRQARDYCRTKSIPFAVATNGSTWVVFPAVRTDAVTFEESQARVFRGLDDIRERFVEFWELLSRQRVIEGNLENELLEPPRDGMSRRVLTLLSEPGFRLGRNALFEQLEPAVTAALSDEALLHDVDALRACYVRNSERVKYDSRLQMYLTDLKPPLDVAVTRARSRKNEGALAAAVDATPPHGQPKFVLLLGPVGAGKTTFIQYTRRISAAEQIDGKLLWFYIDFKKATKEDRPRAFIYRELLELVESDEVFALGDWEHSIRPAYSQLAERLARGPLQPLKQADPAAFEQRISDMIMADRVQIEPYIEKIMARAVAARPGFVVLDNVDQIDDDSIQRDIFSEAQAAARRLGLNVIMSLRDATYLRHRSSPIFDAFQVDALYIDPPSVSSVLSRRFALAKRVLADRSAEIVAEGGARFVVPDLSIFFEVVSGSLLSGDSGFLLEVLSGGDIRRGLHLVREFLASGHTSADKALQVYMASGAYQFPTHEVFRAVVLGARRYFREEESVLLNIFDSKLGTSSLQLIRLNILARFVHLASSPSFDGLRSEEIVEQFHRLGVPAADVEGPLRALVDSRMLKTADGLEFSRESVLVPTRLAGFSLQVLSGQFAYLEMCTLDSLIHDSLTWEKIRELTTQIEQPSRSLAKIPLRLDRTEVFLLYLRQLEEAWTVECKRRGLSAEWALSPIAGSVLPAYQIEKERVQRSAERQAN